MTNETNQQTRRPFGLSFSDFEPLLPAEAELKKASRLGKVAAISVSRPVEAGE